MLRLPTRRLSGYNYITDFCYNYGVQRISNFVHVPRCVLLSSRVFRSALLETAVSTYGVLYLDSRPLGITITFSLQNCDDDDAWFVM